jgi:hypothetical protein
VAVCLALLYLAAALALPHFITAETVRDLLARELEDRVPEARIHLESANITLLPSPRISLENLSLVVPGNTLLQIRRLEGAPDLASLLTGSPRPGSIVLQGPKLIMGLPQKTVNWIRPDQPRGLSALLGALPEVEGTIGNGEMHLYGETDLHVRDIGMDLDIAKEVRLDLRARSNFSNGLTLDLRSTGNRTRIMGGLRTEELRLELLAPYLSPGAAQWIGSSRIDMDTEFSFAGPNRYQARTRLNPSRLRLTSRDGSGTFRLKSGVATVSGHAGETRIRLKGLDLTSPRSRLEGSVTLGSNNEGVSLDLTAEGLGVSPLAATLKGLFPGEEFLETFSIIRAGTLPWGRITASGKTKEAFLADLSIQGRLEEGKIDLPEPEVVLDRVRGTFFVVQDALSMTDLAGTFGDSKITSGRAAMGLGDDVDPLCLHLESRLDLAQTVDLLQRNLDIPKLQKELKRIESLRGEADASFGLTKRGEDVKWEAELSRIHLQARHEALPLPFSLDSGKVAYEEQTLSFSQLRGNVGKSSIKALKGSLRFGPSTGMRLAGEKIRLDLEELAALLADYPGLASWETTLGTLEGTMDLQRFSLKGELQSPKQWDFSASGSLPRLRVDPPFLSYPLKASAESLSSQGRDLSWSGLTLSTPGARIHGQGKLTFGPQGLEAIRCSAGGTIRSPELLDRLYAKLPVPEALCLKAPLTFGQGRFQWRGKEDFSLRTDFGLAGNTSGHLHLAANNAAYQLRRLQLRQENASATLRASLRGRALDIAFDGELALSRLRSALRRPGPLHGDLEGDFRASLNISPFRFLGSHGSLRVSELDLPPALGRPHLRLNRAHLEGRGQEISLREFRLRVANRPVDVNGSVEIARESNILDLNIRAGELDREWIKTVRGLTRVKDRGNPVSTSAFRGLMQVRIDSFHHGEQSIGPIRAIVDMGRDRTTILLKEAELCQLDPLGSLVLGDKTMTAEISASVRDKNLARTISCLGGGHGLMSGEFALSLRSQSEGRDLSGLKSNNQGRFRFLARDGRIHRINILAKILALLNTTEILFGNLPDLEEEGFGYRAIKAKGTIEGRTLHLKEMIVDGTSMNIAASGDIDLFSGKMDVIVLVSPLKTVDRIISWIPLVNYILRDTLISLPFRVSGKPGDPMVVPLSPEAVGTEVFGIMKRTLSLPFKVLQPLLTEQEQEENSEE